MAMKKLVQQYFVNEFRMPLVQYRQLTAE